jgi:hypothetical protein
MANHAEERFIWTQHLRRISHHEGGREEHEGKKV